ncbi:unnamed protein product [Arabis nemorensis]|uniref:Uncharacterized protein n=1 Tax=Arabis nemorensis TaxID=586526 RepID=A0A565BIB0_9BRAS|nr:unnamed protein product [Arabis nemorensis]
MVNSHLQDIFNIRDGDKSDQFCELRQRLDDMPIGGTMFGSSLMRVIALFLKVQYKINDKLEHCRIAGYKFSMLCNKHFVILFETALTIPDIEYVQGDLVEIKPWKMIYEPQDL